MTIAAKSTSSSGTATAAGLRPPPSTQSQTAPNGRPTTSRWTAVGTRGDASGTTPESASGRTTLTARSHISMLPANSLPDWPFNDPGYTVFPVFNLAVAGSGGGDPGPGSYPAADARRLHTRLVAGAPHEPTSSGWNLAAIRRSPSCQSTVVPPMSSCIRVTSVGSPRSACSLSSNTGSLPTSEPR